MIVERLLSPMKIRNILLFLLVSIAKTSLGQIDQLVLFDLSSDSATKNTDTWVDYSKILMAYSSETNFMYYVHNGSAPLVSKFDSRRKISRDEMKLIKKSPPNAVYELRNILIELDDYVLGDYVSIDVVCGSDVFLSNDRLLYERLKIILEQLGTEVKLVYHIPDTEKSITRDLMKIKEYSIFQIKYF